MSRTMPDRDGEITEWCAAAIRGREMNIIELAKEAGFIINGGRIESPYIGGSDIGHRLKEFANLVRADEQMKALEAARTIGGDLAVLFEREYLK